jgi:hypothetical protein
MLFSTRPKIHPVHHQGIIGFVGMPARIVESDGDIIIGVFGAETAIMGDKVLSQQAQTTCYSNSNYCPPAEN